MTNTLSCHGAEVITAVKSFYDAGPNLVIDVCAAIETSDLNTNRLAQT